MGRQRYEAGDCAPADSQVCFLWLKAGADKHVEEAMRFLALKYRTDPIKLMWVSVELNPSVLEAFGLQDADRKTGHSFVAYRPKRGRFQVHQGQLNSESLDAFVNDVMEGR